jgi:ketosteroid isomerase-like protein
MLMSESMVDHLRGSGIALLAGVCLASPAMAADAAAGTALQREVEAVIHDTAARWSSQDFASVLELWDADEPMPMYLAEEQKDWFIGWPALRAYLGTSTPFIEAIREEMTNIRVQPLADDLVAAVWDMHFEMKYRGSPALGEDIRVTAILRRKPEGWRYVHYAEAPMTGTMYVRKLMQRDVRPEFDAVYRDAQKKRAANPPPAKAN